MKYRQPYHHRLVAAGFALPTVLITSIVMLLLLATAAQMVASVKNSLDNQYYTQLAREAAQAGVIYAQSCLRENGYDAQWTDASPLEPDRTCKGVSAGSGPGHPGPFVLRSNDGTYRSKFRVGKPSIANGAQVITSVGTVQRVRRDGTVWRTYTQYSNGRLGAEINFNSVAFGYHMNEGAFFGVIQPSGKVTMVGLNSSGQLGNGTTTNSAHPTEFILPSGEVATQAFTSFLSLGTMFAVSTNSGNVYVAGVNASGQLGNGTRSPRETRPVRMQLPSGVKPTTIGLLQHNVVIIGSDNRVYTTGNCTAGVIGNGQSTSGCAAATLPRQVALPDPDPGNPNTLPVQEPGWVQPTNLAVDGNFVMLRMQGGRVYTWGHNAYGAAGQGTAANIYRSPVQVGEFGNPGKPKAIQVSTDSVSSYILDDQGSVWAAGANFSGQLGGAPATIKAGNGRVCLDNSANRSSAGHRLKIYGCHGGVNQRVEISPDERLRFRPNARTELCAEVPATPYATSPVTLERCHSANQRQRWEVTPSGQLRSLWGVHTGRNVCLENPDNATTPRDVMINWCRDNEEKQRWTPGDSPHLTKVPVPGRVVRVAFDHHTPLFLTDNGEVWGAGNNQFGQLGNGQTSVYSPRLTRFGAGVVPGDRKVVDFYTTGYGRDDSLLDLLRANSYVVLDNGEVWGAGSNTQGQLGNGSFSHHEAKPVRMDLPRDVRGKSVQSGFGTTVVLSVAGRVYTVGDNAQGQLGDGTTNNSAIPKANKYTNSIPIQIF